MTTMTETTGKKENEFSCIQWNKDVATLSVWNAKCRNKLIFSTAHSYFVFGLFIRIWIAEEMGTAPKSKWK